MFWKIARRCPVASVVLLTAAVLILVGLGAPDAGATSSSYVDFGRYDTYDALLAAEQDGVTVGGLPGEVGEVILATVPYSSFDNSGSYNGGGYY